MSTAIAEIFSQGDEVLTGQVADTNAAWLARQVSRIGFDVVRHSAVGDRLEPMIEQLRVVAQRADLCIGTGGLGPTVDDLTAAAVAAAFNRPLTMDLVALEQIEAYFACRGRAMAPVNRKQAWLPQGGKRIDNHWGTAPGFELQEGGCRFVFLPGVPSEMKAMYTHGVEPLLLERFRLTPPRLTVLRSFGLGESALQQRLEPLLLPGQVRLGFRAGVHENEVKLLFPVGFPADEADRLVTQAAQLIGDAVFSVGDAEAPGGSLATTVGALLDARGASLVTAETYSGGQLAWQCRGQAGLLQSVVAGESKRLFQLLGIEHAEGESDRNAEAGLLADTMRRTARADYALVVLGPAPAAETEPLLPVTTVAIALAEAFGASVVSLSFFGTHERRQRQAAATALDCLRRHLMREPVSG